MSNETTAIQLHSFLTTPERRAKLAQWCGQKMDPASLERFALLEAQRSPKLRLCAPSSVYLALIAAAQFQLEPSGATGEGYIVPYQNSYKDANGKWHKVMVAQFIPGYRGLVKLARMSGEIEDIYTYPVGADDHFEEVRGLEPNLIHRPADSPSEVIKYYAVAVFKSGYRRFEVMTRQKVEAIRQASSGRNSPAWKNHFDEMARKTVIRRITKTLPMGHLFVRAAQVDTAIATGDLRHYREVIDVHDEVGALEGEDQAQLEAPPAESSTISMAELALRIEGAQDLGQLEHAEVMAALEQLPSGAPERAAWTKRRRALSVD